MASESPITDDLSPDISRMTLNDPIQRRRQDITQKLFSATNSLSIGQVIRAPDFSFLDALGALEIMDPKTDSGMIPDDEIAFDDTSIQSLLPEEVIWIMDQLLAREISWHSGNPLAQTLFTCTYLADSLLNFKDTLESATFVKDVSSGEVSFGEKLVTIVLRGYILGVIKCCDCARAELQKGNIYEEEDVATNTASLVLLGDIQVPQFTALLQQALAIIATEKRTTKSASLDALETRLDFRKSFLEIVSNNPTSAKERRPELKKCLSLLPLIVASMDLGKETNGAFSTRIQRRLSISVPPRPMVSIDPKEAAKSIKSILDNLLQFESLYEFKSPHEIINFFDYFAAREPIPFAYVRSVLQSHFNTDDLIFGKGDSDSFLMDVLVDICHPQNEYFLDKGTQTQHPTSQKCKIQQCLQGFLERTTPNYMDLFRIKCHNKSRQRRNLANLIQEWELIQLDVEKIDMALSELIPQKSVARAEEEGPKHAFPLCSWVFHIKLTIFETVLLMGFELDLYQPYEYVLIYGYLGHAYLLHNQQLERVKKHVHLPRKRKSQAKEALYIDFLILRNTIMENMCKAYCSLFMVLRALDLIRLPTRDKTKEYMRYALRLKPFWGLSSPEILPFESYQQLFTIPNSRPVMINLLQTASEQATVARHSIETLIKMNPEQCRMRYCYAEFKEEMKNLMKSCISVGIFIETILKQVYQDTSFFEDKTIIVEPKYHSRFVAVKIVDRRKTT